MILEAMLQRLYSSLQKGPSLNARPHNSRQRVDLVRFSDFQNVSADAILPCILGAAKKLTLPAAVAPFRKPEYPEDEWSDEQKKHARDWERQTRLLKKLQDIAIDAQDYYNDHGEDALFIGFPIISLPPVANDDGFNKSRVLAPAAFIPIKLSIQKKTRPGATLSAVGDGSDLLIPNPALLAWLEQQTGEELPELFDDDTGDDPEREYHEILDFILKSLDLDEEKRLDFACQLKPVKGTQMGL